MSTEEESEYIDKSCWLPLKIVHGYADFAIAHGRKVFNNGSIVPSVRDLLPIERLALPKNKGGEEILTDSHKNAGISFRVLWDCVEGRISAYGAIDGEEKSHIDPQIKKIAIESQLLPSQKHMVRRVLVYPVYEQDYVQFHRIAGNLQKAFDDLLDAMKKENVQRAIEKFHDTGKAIMPANIKNIIDKHRANGLFCD